MTRRPIIGIIAIVIAILMVLDHNHVIDLSFFFQSDWKAYIIPVCIFLLGIKLISTPGRHDHDARHNGLHQADIPEQEAGKPLRLTACLAGNEYNFNCMKVGDMDLQAFMGGMSIDLRGAEFSHSCDIEIRTFMGGIDIHVPTNVRVEVSSDSLLGGVDNKTLQTPDSNAPTLYIHANCMFGGVKIKN